LKKALHGQEEAFIVEIQGQPRLWDMTGEEVVDAINESLAKPLIEGFHDATLHELSDWLNRYLEEGVLDPLLDDLNNLLADISYRKFVLPLDLLPSDTGYPRSGYMSLHSRAPSPTRLAADEFSRILSSGLLGKLKKCQLGDCEKFFLGRPQAKWCSKSCGSKYRVAKKRKRDAT
jgi:CGNR zinc finger